MRDAWLIDVTIGLRLAVAVTWSIVGGIGFAAFVRLIARRALDGDVRWASLMLIGVGLLIFQWRALAGYTAPSADPFAAIALFSFLLSAATFLIVRQTKAPEGHQRAAIISHAAMIGLLLTAGLLSS